MDIQKVSFTGDKPKKRSFLKDVGSSAINVGATVGAGAIAGGTAGKIASLVPYKIKDADMAFQYGDMFLRAANSETMPEMYKGASETVKNFIQTGRSCLVAQKGYLDQADEMAGFLKGVMQLSDDAIKSKETQEAITKFFKDAPDKIPAGGYTKEIIKTKVNEGLDHAANAFRGYSQYFDEIQGKFVETVKSAKNSNWDEIAAKGAKALRNRTIIGAGIAIGVVGALVLNIVKSYKSAAKTVSKNDHQG